MGLCALIIRTVYRQQSISLTAIDDWSNGNCCQSGNKTNEHEWNKSPRITRRLGKFPPHEYSPNCGDQRGPLANGVGNVRADDLGVRGREIQNRTRAPDHAADDSPEMPG